MGNINTQESDVVAEGYRTDFLVSSPSMLGGMGTVLNIGGNYYDYNYSKSESEADRRALASDWGMVLQDFRAAFRAFLSV